MNLFVRVLWGMFAILFLRLIFANGGVVQYVQSQKILSAKTEELKAIQLGNDILRQEIVKIESDTSFQKKLVRENLGVIAADEYLILFAEENSFPLPSRLKKGQEKTRQLKVN